MPRNKKTVDIIREVGQLNLIGNVIPHHWFKCITFENNKPDLLAIMILGEIIYWYRPQAVKDEQTGRFLGIKKKFKADLLQRNAKSFAKQFGCSLRQAQNALARLEEQGLIKREFRTIEIAGERTNNVPFIEPMTGNIQQLESSVVFCDEETDTSTTDADVIKDTPSCNRIHQGVYPITHPGVMKRHTYTETTPEITTEKAAEKKDDISQQEAESERSSFAAAADCCNQKLDASGTIGKKLTLPQIQAMKQKLSTLQLTTGDTAATLQHAVLTSLVDENQFTTCHPQFAKKLNVICKMYREGNYSPQAVLSFKQQAEQDKQQQHIQVRLGELRKQYRELRGDIKHFELVLRDNLPVNDFTAMLPAYADKKRTLSELKTEIDALSEAMGQNMANLSEAENRTVVSPTKPDLSTDLPTENVDKRSAVASTFHSTRSQ